MSVIFNYVDIPNSNLICCICHAPFVRPVTTLTCAHTFCYECISHALEHSPHCPIDRRLLKTEDLVDAGGIVRALVDELIVECPHRAEGCETKCQRQVLAVHLREDCQLGEAVKDARRSVEMHKKEETEDLQNEEEEEMKCPHATHGCTFSCAPKTCLLDHLSTCPYEFLKDYISSSNAKTALLTEQNMVLRHRLETMEGAVQGLKREMGVMKGVLGPWFKGASQDATILVGGERRRSIDGGYLDMERERRDYFGNQHQPASGGFFRTHSIAPLEVGSSVEDTLLGLRESVVGLSGVIDAVCKRGEIALANEALRLGEEMMSIRAQIHGLRMQVHGMMMERNGMPEGCRFGPSNITKL